MPDFRLPRRAASKVDFVAPRPKFVWPRREPLYACSDAAEHVPDDGGREPGTGVLRPVRGVRGPRDTGDSPHRCAGRTRARRQLRDPTGFDVSHACTLLGSLLSASYYLEDVRDLPENGA